MSDAVMVPPRVMEAIAHNLCSLHGFDPAFVKQSEPFARAVITEYERAMPTPTGILRQTKRLIEIIGSEVCVMADHGDSIDPSSVKDAADAIMAILAASPSVGGWEDISTAPKDGTRMCVAFDDCPDLPYHWEIGRFSRSKGWVNTYGHPFSGEPTHWFVPAAPPSVSTGSRPQEAVPTEQAAPTVVSGWDREICTGCTASLSIADIKARGIVSCCPDRHMVRIGDLVDAYTARPPRITPQPAEGCSSNEGADDQGQECLVCKGSGEFRIDDLTTTSCRRCDGVGRILPQTEKGS